MKFRLPTLAPPTFNVLCLGERGTGKTVFLIASYAEFQKNIANINKNKRQEKDDKERKFYFECQGMGESILLDNILRYILSEGSYPPPTLAVTDFNFAITEQKANHYDLLGFLRWWDMPGEYCNFSNSYYQKMAMDSHAICLFINANRLVNDESYQENFNYIQTQLMVLVDLARKFNLKYPFSIIFTQCDLLSLTIPPEAQVAFCTKSLLQALDEAGVNYQCFYSAIKIENLSGRFELSSNRVISVFSWIAENLHQSYREGNIANLRVASVFHCLHCGSDRFKSTKNISLSEKLELLGQLRWQYRCSNCGKTKVEFLPFVLFHWLKNLFRRK